MLEKLTSMGIHILSVEKEMLIDEQKTVLITVGIGFITAVLMLLAWLIASLISQHSAFETTVRYSGSVIAGAIMLLGIVAICAVNINAIQVETGRALYEIIVEDSDTLDALSGEFEIVDYSSYPVITIAAPMPPCGLVS